MKETVKLQKRVAITYCASFEESLGLREAESARAARDDNDLALEAELGEAAGDLGGRSAEAEGLGGRVEAPLLRDEGVCGCHDGGFDGLHCESGKFPWGQIRSNETEWLDAG